MILRNEAASRYLALSIIASPLVALGIWGWSSWSADGRRIAVAQRAIYETEARIDQARQYRSLGAAWQDYIASELAGRAPENASQEPAAIGGAKLATMFERFGGAALITEAVSEAQNSGLAHARLEVHGALPETSLAGFLAALESEAPILFVDLVDLSRHPDDASQLRIRLRVSIYQLGGAPS